MRTKHVLIFAVTLLALMLLSAFVFVATPMGDALADVRPTATPELLSSDHEQSSPSAPEALPDLIVEDILLSPREPYVNQDVIAFVTIKNIGAADVADGNNFHLDLYINPPTDDLKGMPGDDYRDVQGHQMKAGESATFAFLLVDVFTDTASYNLWAQVDTAQLPTYTLGFVLESNEDNNVLGPVYMTGRTHYQWIQKDHADFFRNMASTLDELPVDQLDPCGASQLSLGGESVLALGVFDEPPKTTWGISPTLSFTDLLDYNTIYPDVQANEVVTNDQQYPFVHAEFVTASIGIYEVVAVVWEDGRNGPTFAKDVFLRWSSDGGETWSQEIQVNETFDGRARNDQKHPAVAVAPNGNIVVVWQDHRDESFDMYVQAFGVETGGGGVSLVRCDDNGDCSTDCNAATQGCNVRVDTDANERDQILPDISVDGDSTFWIAWQDQRNYNDDIFSVRSYYTDTQCYNSRSSVGYAPKSTLDWRSAPDQVLLCWGDDTRIHDDPTVTKQAAPSIEALTGVKVVGLEYELIPPIFPGDPPDIVVTKVLTELATYVTVAWEDWRTGDADIYFVYSEDKGETYVVDEMLNDDKLSNVSNGIDQLAPSTSIVQWMKLIALEMETEFGTAIGEVKLPVTTIFAGWQDFRHSTNPDLNNDPDVYLTARTIQPAKDYPWPMEIIVEFEPYQVNEHDTRTWQTDPVWQGPPDVSAKMSGLTLGEADGYNAYVVWADGRNYGGEFENLDVYYRVATNLVDKDADLYLQCVSYDCAVNDGVHLHSFDDNLYTAYRRDKPPHGRQRHPSIASTLVTNWATIIEGYIYTAWDDDRISNPFEDRNVYVARSNNTYGGHRRLFIPSPPPPGDPPAPGALLNYGSGAFVSEVFDSGSVDTIWYMVDWHAATDNSTYITLQTRLGNTREEVLNGDWYPKRFPYPDDAITVGSPLQGYDAPGQHIEDVEGNYWPQARYIQYRINLWARNFGGIKYTPCLYDVLLHYERPPIVYLPIVFKNQRP